MSPSHQGRGHPAFPLSDATVTQEVVAVHQGQLAQEELDGALAPPFLRTLALRERQGSTPGGGVLDAGVLDSSDLLQQASDELLVAAASLTALTDVGG